MKILHLTLKRKWFDLIASGQKTIEYRVWKSYWQSRFLKRAPGCMKWVKFEEVHFRNGYAKDSPFMRVKCNGIIGINPLRTKYPPCHGEVLNGRQFGILLGPILELTWRTKND